MILDVATKKKLKEADIGTLVVDDTQLRAAVKITKKHWLVTGFMFPVKNLYKHMDEVYIVSEYDDFSGA